MNRLAILFLLAFFTAPAICIGDVLDEAIKIVVDNSPSLQGQDALLGIAERKKVWTSKLSLGANYAQADTLDNASGTDLRARLQFEIPLFDDGGKGKSVAEAKTALAVEKDRVIGAFLQKVTNIVILERKIRTAAQDYELAQQRLEYYQKAQEKGVVEGIQLWQQVEAVNTAQNTIFLAKESYSASVSETARQYGGLQHVELGAKINQYVRSQAPAAPATPPQAGNPPPPTPAPAPISVPTVPKQPE